MPRIVKIVQGMKPELDAGGILKSLDEMRQANPSVEEAAARTLMPHNRADTIEDLLGCFWSFFTDNVSEVDDDSFCAYMDDKCVGFKFKDKDGVDHSTQTQKASLEHALANIQCSDISHFSRESYRLRLNGCIEVPVRICKSFTWTYNQKYLFSLMESWSEEVEECHLSLGKPSHEFLLWPIMTNMLPTVYSLDIDDVTGEKDWLDLVMKAASCAILKIRLSGTTPLLPKHLERIITTTLFELTAFFAVPFLEHTGNLGEHPLTMIEIPTPSGSFSMATPANCVVPRAPSNSFRLLF